MKVFYTLIISSFLFSFNQASNIEESNKYLKMAVEEEHKGQDSKALNYLNKAIELHSENTKALEERGDLYSIIGNLDEALKDYETALNIKEEEQLYFKLGVLYTDLGKDIEALFYFNKTLEYDLENYEYHYYKGVALMNLGKNTQALLEFNRADDLHKDDHNVYYHRALAHMHMHHYQLSIEDLNNAIKLYDKNSDYYFERGVCYSNLKEYEKAIQDFTKAIEKGDDIDAYLERALAYDKIKKYELAEKDVQHYLNQNPNNPVAQYQFGLIEFHAKKYKSAEKWFNKVLEVEKNNKKAHFYLGMVYFNTNRKDDACKEFKTCKKLGYISGYNKMKEHCK